VRVQSRLPLLPGRRAVVGARCRRRDGRGGAKAVSVMIGRHDMDVGIVTGRMGPSTPTMSMVVWRRMRRR
jgi:hypothetical protein